MNSIYCLKNVYSGKYLNPHNGYDTDGINVYQWSCDGSTEQKFKIVYDSSQDAYRFYTMCSSNGNNRVLDIVKYNGQVVSGCNVEIYRPIDNTAQLWKITQNSDGSFSIRPKANTNVALAVYGTSNGSSSGTSSTSYGNAYISTYSNSSSQKWKLEKDSSSTNYGDYNWSYVFKSPYMARNISSPYDYRWGEFHYGVDITTGVSGQVEGYPVHSANSGRVGRAYYSSSGGNMVIVCQNDGFTTRYLHLDSRSVSTNETISKGTKIGEAGNTGNSYGAHLHMDVNTTGAWYGNSSTNPVCKDNTIDPTLFYPQISFTYIG